MMGWDYNVCEKEILKPLLPNHFWYAKISSSPFFSFPYFPLLSLNDRLEGKWMSPLELRDEEEDIGFLSAFVVVGSCSSR